jgi:hypothetical protein
MTSDSFTPYIPRPKIGPKIYKCLCGRLTHNPESICGPCRAEKRAGLTWDEVRAENTCNSQD